MFPEKLKSTQKIDKGRASKMGMATEEITFGKVTTGDGTAIGYRMIGQGPGLVIVHGAFRASQHYERLARALADRYTVYIMDRRGRNESGPKGDGYSLQTECDDVIALMREKDISLYFGHSYGGLVGVLVALQYPLSKLAMYEPAVFLNEFLSIDWMPRFERELAEQDFVSASVTFLNGLQGGVIGKLPRWVMKLMLRAMQKSPDWKENEQLLLTLPVELRAGIQLDASQERIEEITTDTLLLSGTKSPGYLLKAMSKLESMLPNAQHQSLEGLDHSAPDENAPEQIATILKEFLG